MVKIYCEGGILIPYNKKYHSGDGVKLEHLVLHFDLRISDLRNSYKIFIEFKNVHSQKNLRKFF